LLNSFVVALHLNFVKNVHYVWVHFGVMVGLRLHITRTVEGTTRVLLYIIGRKWCCS